MIAALVAGLLALGFVASSADAARSCGTVRAGDYRYKITIERGVVSCPKARGVLRAFLRGKGTLHGPVNGPAAKQSWKLRRWWCGHGAGGGACRRGGSDYANARDFILAQS